MKSPTHGEWAMIVESDDRILKPVWKLVQCVSLDPSLLFHMCMGFSTI
jgi:hypothetical protein